MKGFTPLPESIASRIEKSTSGHYIVCKVRESDGRLRRSDEMYLGGGGRAARDLSGLSAVVMPERTAFRPGETVRFKAVVYESSSDGKMDVSTSRAVTDLIPAKDSLNPEAETISEAQLSVTAIFLLCSVFK